VRLQLVMAPVLAPLSPCGLAGCCAPLASLFGIVDVLKGHRSKGRAYKVEDTTCSAAVSCSASAGCCIPGSVQHKDCQQQHRQRQAQGQEQEQQEQCQQRQRQHQDQRQQRPGGHTTKSSAAASISGITETDFEQALEEVVATMQPWEDGAFVFVQTLQEASRNFGRVDLMTRRSDATNRDDDQRVDEDCGEGQIADEKPADESRHFEQVAVKRMPKHWVGAGPDDFNRKHLDASERPWDDLGFLKWLNNLSFPHVCSLYGVFADAENLYVVSSLALQGDLFAWTFHATERGYEREVRIRPLALQALSAVRWLHDLGIGHRDLSLENFVLEDLGGGSSRLKVIDFAMATLLRPCWGTVGKRSYQPPEMHTGQPYDPFAVDVFELGVTLFTMATKNYPWSSTRPEKCALFRYASDHGFSMYLRARKYRKGSSLRIAEVLTPPFCELLAGMLDPTPSDRLCLGEACFHRRRRLAWDLPWWEGLGPVEASKTHEAAAGFGRDSGCSENVAAAAA